MERGALAGSQSWISIGGEKLRTHPTGRVVVAVAVAGLVVLAACGSSSKKTSATGGTTPPGTSKYPPIPAGPIKIGGIMSISGATAAYGLASKKALEDVAIPKFNAMHPDGIDGHPVQFTVYDDGSDVTKGVSAANQMLSDKLAATVFISNAPATAAQEMAVLNKGKMPVLAGVAANAYADTSAWPYFFNISSTIKQVGQATADWIAKHPEIKKIAVLSDGAPSSQELQDATFNPLKTSAPSVQLVKQVTVSPGAVEVSTQIAQLKDSNPDLLFVNLGFGFGPVWQAIQSANWSPKILANAGAFYDGYSGMGPLANNAVAGYYNCVKANHSAYPPELTGLMDAYGSVFGASSVNYLVFVQGDSVAFEMLKKAIEKVHSIDPDAIKQALETMGPSTYFGAFKYSYTASDHAAVGGDYGAAACSMAPLVDGAYRQPLIAP
jgi:ABC-type branched-subunit amino acid transport system substrate-binding protein